MRNFLPTRQVKQKGPVNGKVKADYSKGGNRVPLGKKANLSEPFSRILPKGKLRNHTKFAATPKYIRLLIYYRKDCKTRSCGAV